MKFPVKEAKLLKQLKITFIAPSSLNHWKSSLMVIKFISHKSLIMVMRGHGSHGSQWRPMEKSIEEFIKQAIANTWMQIAQLILVTFGYLHIFKSGYLNKYIYIWISEHLYIQYFIHWHFEVLWFWATISAIRL